jgi:hypothetical protein
MANISYIGTKLFVKAGVPSPLTITGYNALTWVEVKGIVDIGAVGDTQNDITIDTLIGRVEHVNGSSDLGEIPVTMTFIAADPGQDVVRSGAGTNTYHSFRVQDADGRRAHFVGVLANLQDRPRSSSEYKGQTFAIRGNSAVVAGTATP